MSRLTDLLAQAKAKDHALGQELEREFKVLSSRRSFGLNFERHRPESVELPGRPVRKGDKVRILPPRGSTAKGDPCLWKVLRFETIDGKKTAHIDLLDTPELRRQQMAVADLIVVAEFKDYIYARQSVLPSRSNLFMTATSRLTIQLCEPPPPAGDGPCVCARLAPRGALLRILPLPVPINCLILKR